MSDRSCDRCRRGVVDVVATGINSVTFTWQDPGTVDAASPTQIELEYAPTKSIRWWRTVRGGTPSGPTIVPTAKGGTLVAELGDTSTYRVEGVVDPWE